MLPHVLALMKFRASPSTAVIVASGASKMVRDQSVSKLPRAYGYTPRYIWGVLCFWI